jgi:predicted permease
MLFQDVRFALRQVTAAPGFCLAVVLTLALGIGVNTAVFSMLDAFLLRKLPYPEPDRIAALIKHQEGINPKTGRAASDEDDSFQGSEWQILKQNLDTVLLASWGGTSGVNLKADTGTGATVRYVRGSRVSAGYFSVLGIPMRLGRSFTEDEDRPKGPPAVILSDALWKSTFHADEALLGKPILLKGEPFTVVGVLPPNVLTPSNADLFTPLQPWTTGECGGSNCGIMVRLKPGATWQQVRAQLSHIRLNDFAEFERQFHGHAWLYPKPLQLALAGEQQGQILVLMVAVSFILLIACANLAGLALVRISRRTREIATRLALGASSWAVLRQLWIETLVLALLGSAVGVALAVGIVDALSNFLPPEMIPVGGFNIDLRVLAFTFAVSLLTSVLFGALPALQAWRIDLRASIVSGGRSITGGSGHLRHWLIGAEVALTVVLLAAAGLMVRTLIHLETQPRGFDPHNVMTAKASLDDARYHQAAGFQTLLAESVAAMRQSPGVDDVAVGLSVPYERGLNDGFKIMDGRQAGTGNGASLLYVTPGYFSTLRIPFFSGRSFTDGDTAVSQPVVIVNQAFARRFLNDPSPLGRHLKISGERIYTVVGVVANVAKRPGMQQTAPISTEPVFYLPATQTPQGLVNIAHIWFQPSWIVRTHNANQSATIRLMQQALARVAPDLPFSGFYSMDQILREQLQQQRIEVLLLTALAGLALLLSVIGIYALVSNLVVQRTREIGIRLVLGSTTSEAMLAIGSSGAVATVGGVGAGIALSFAALRVLSSEIYGVQVYDPLTLIAVPCLLGIVAAAAICLPALRIAHLRPAETLRSE